MRVPARTVFRLSPAGIEIGSESNVSSFFPSKKTSCTRRPATASFVSLRISASIRTSPGAAPVCTYTSSIETAGTARSMTSPPILSSGDHWATIGYNAPFPETISRSEVISRRSVFSLPGTTRRVMSNAKGWSAPQ